MTGDLTDGCSVDGCERDHYGRGFCKLHWRRWKRTGDPGPAASTRSVYVRQTATVCTVDGCERPVKRLDLCSMHVHRVLASGDPGPATRIAPPRRGRCEQVGCGRMARTSSDTLCVDHLAAERLLEQFWARVQMTGCCWLWTGTVVRGYGRVERDGHVLKAHRVAYELLVGPIGDGLVLDHLCRVKVCVNPDHVQPVTQAENFQRGLRRVQHSTAFVFEGVAA